MKTGFLITARLKSTRLPEKLLREVEGRAIFAHMIDRIKLARRVDEIIVCTSTHPQDERLAELAAAEGISFFRGDEDDVVKRIYDAAVAFGCDYALSITADCPFVDPVYADKIVAAFEETNADLIRAFDLPHGAFSYGVKIEALGKVLEIKDSKDTEVWTRYFTDTDLFEVYDLPIDNHLHRQPGLRMTLDYPEDLEFFKAVFANLYKPGKVFSLDEILLFLGEHPKVVEINSACAAPFWTRWTRQSSISLKPRYTVKRAAILGCGSIGQRHVRNLRRLGITDIIALRSRQGHHQELAPELGVREVEGWQELIDFSPDIAIISNPSNLHLETAARLLPHVRGLFIEKPLASSLEGVADLLGEIKRQGVVSFVGFVLQFHPAVRLVKELLKDERFGKPLIFQCQVGQWLPDWHPYEDYRQAYYASKSLGGGALLTLSHEVHLAYTLLGTAQSASCLLSESELLPLEVDAMADLMIRHNSGAVSQVHLDFIQLPAHRRGIVSCERGWISYNLTEPEVLARVENEVEPRVLWRDQNLDTNQPFVDELEQFLNYVREGRVRHEMDAWHAARAQAILDAARSSASSERLARIPEWVASLT